MTVNGRRGAFLLSVKMKEAHAMPLNLDYFYGSEAEQFSFYRIPKILFTNQHYKAVSLEARVLYGLLLDRMGLSSKNDWRDADGRVFIYFAQEDAQECLCCGRNKVIALFKELEEYGLIERKKQGQGKPAKLYVKNFAAADTQTSPPKDSRPPETGIAEVSKEDFQTSRNRRSKRPKTGGQDLPKQDPNNTEKKKTEKNDIEPSSPSSPPLASAGRVIQRRRIRMDEMDSYRELLRENIDYDSLVMDCPCDIEIFDGYVEMMAEVCCSRKDFIRIGGEEVATGIVKSRFLKLNREHITYVRDCLCHTTATIGNIKAYTLSALYNAPTTMEQYYAAKVSRDLAQESG